MQHKYKTDWIITIINLLEWRAGLIATRRQQRWQQIGGIMKKNDSFDCITETFDIIIINDFKIVSKNKINNAVMTNDLKNVVFKKFY